MSIPGQRKTKTRVAILGPGAVGGFLAAVLWKSGVEVVCIARKDATVRMEQEGLRFKSQTFGTFTAKPLLVVDPSWRPEVLFITVKAPVLKEALESVPDAFKASTVVIPLLNGVDHMAILKHTFTNVAAGSIGIEVYVDEAGMVIHSSKDARISLASNAEEVARKLPEIGAILTHAGIELRILPTEAEVLWKKLVRLAPLALTTASSKKTLGAILADKGWRAKFEACAREAVQIANAEGGGIKFPEVMSDIRRLHPEQSSSLARDIMSGKPSELDAIAGAIIRRGERYGIPCPTTSGFYNELSRKPPHLMRILCL